MPAQPAQQLVPIVDSQQISEQITALATVDRVTVSQFGAIAKQIGDAITATKDPNDVGKLMIQVDNLFVYPRIRHSIK